MIRLCLFLVLLPALAAAQDFPARYDVSGVASDDTLNVRAGPGTGHPVIGELAHDATGVEIVARAAGANWGLVNVGERAGWASLAFMARQPGTWSGAPTTITACFGTEPFWSLSGFNGPTLTLENLGTPVLNAPSEGFAGSAALPWQGLSAESPGGGFMSLLVQAEMCSDGMSDQQYGLSAKVISRVPGVGTQVWSGCCTVGVR